MDESRHELGCAQLAESGRFDFFCLTARIRSCRGGTGDSSYLLTR
jgi:hypothetical protein